MKYWAVSGSVGRAVASDSRGPRFKSSHRQNLDSVNCIEIWKDENKRKKRPGMAHFWKNVKLFSVLNLMSRFEPWPRGCWPLVRPSVAHYLNLCHKMWWNIAGSKLHWNMCWPNCISPTWFDQSVCWPKIMHIITTTHTSFDETTQMVNPVWWWFQWTENSFNNLALFWTKYLIMEIFY